MMTIIWLTGMCSCTYEKFCKRFDAFLAAVVRVAGIEKSDGWLGKPTVYSDDARSHTTATTNQPVPSLR